MRAEGRIEGNAMGEDGTMEGGRQGEGDRDGKGEEKGMINPFETDRTSGDVMLFLEKINRIHCAQ